ncbi:MAG: GNAT family N-acetyltransferase [Methylococcaceae bacterium]|nr:MAG: GNAT family N-acetyltransferase [Methylococcaceae bacterium]
MGQHYLSTLFSPKSVAVFGASNREDAVGTIVYQNLLAGFQGEVYGINPKRPTIQDKPTYADLEEIGQPIELAVIVTPAASIPAIIESCGKHGIKAAVVLSAGFSEIGPKGAALQKTLTDTAKLYGVRLLGPNCLGIMRPSIGLNATFYKGDARPGNLALVSQSGALCTAILDWADAAGVGFSSVVSVGTSADIDFGEVLDYLVSDPKTDSILLYIEGIHQSRSFVSALRAASRVKPVIGVKVGRHLTGSKAAVSHTGALVGADDVFDAALRRAGVVRVKTIAQMFTAAQALAYRQRPTGNRLAIITNGGGPGAMAADQVADRNISLAELAPETLAKMDGFLPSTWSHGNPVDIIGDATPERYRQALETCMEDGGVDGVLVILTPQAMTRPLEVAQAVSAVAAQYPKPLLTCWMGDTQIKEGQEAFIQAGIPTFRTPEPAVDAFSYIAAYHQNQKLLLQTPGPLSQRDEPDVEGARMLIESALSERRRILNEMESKALLAAFHIPVASTMIARSPNEALMLAEQFGFPIALKVNSPDITHKSDSGGVKLGLNDAHAVRTGYNDILTEVKKNRPNARIDGIAVQPMIRKPNGRELMIGVTNDPIFGPIITFGAGGIMVEVMGDRAVTLPPLNNFLAHSLIDTTRIAKLLGAFRHMPPVDRAALENVLLRVSEMVCELPWLKEMDINPLIVDENGALAVDARVVVDYAPTAAAPYEHMAIHPYPAHLTSQWQLPDGTDIIIRPIRPEDAELEQEFVRGLSEESRFFRFMTTLHELTPAMLARFTQIDYDREMALIAVTVQNGKELELGVCRYAINPDGESCEFALVVSDAWQGKGLGTKLMGVLLNAARTRGLKRMEGEVLGSNTNMLKLMKILDFGVTSNEDDPAVKRVTKVLNA